MLPRHDRLRSVLWEWLMTALVAYALALPAVAALGIDQEALFALGCVALFSLAVCLPNLLGVKARRLVRLMMLAAGAVLAFSVGKGIAALLPAVVDAQSQLVMMLVLYSDAVVLLSALMYTLYAQLLVRGDPVFSAPLIAVPAVMMWFAGARQHIWHYLPAVLALPMLFVYGGGQGQLGDGEKPRRMMLRALPVVLIIAVAAYALTPPYRATVPALERQADRLRTLINDHFFFTDSRQMFSLRSMGYQPMGDVGLGGKPDISGAAVMSVTTDRKVYLRGAVLDQYSGKDWRDSVSSERYGYTSFRFRALRDSLLDADLPASGRLPETRVGVQMLSGLASTLFTPQRVRKLTTGEGMVPYFNGASELFITRNLREGDAYTVAYEPYVAGRPETDALAASLAGRGEARAMMLPDVYTQLPVHLVPGGVIETLAQSIAGGEATSYDQAMALMRHLKRHYTYSLDVPNVPEDMDFAAYFLLDTREGYCTYFATAMTVLCRSLGLPARYIEGFVAEPGEGGMPALVTGYQAHAWTEVYIDGLGWVTFDATSSPGEPESEDVLPPDGGANEPPTPPPTEPPPPPEDGESPTPTPPPEDSEDQPTPTPTAPPAPATDQEDRPDGDRFGPACPWLLLLLLAVGFVVWRALASRPDRRARRAKNDTERLMIYWQGVCLALAMRGQGIRPPETISGYAARVRPDDRAFDALAAAVSAAAYGRHAPRTEAVSQARGLYRALYRALPLRLKALLILRRIRGDIALCATGGWAAVKRLFKKLPRAFRRRRGKL